MEKKSSPVLRLLVAFAVGIAMVQAISCDLWVSRSPDQYVTFLPEDREWEMSILDPVSDWEGTGEDRPEWQFSELSEDYPADNPLGYHIYPQHDADGNKSADITYLKELGTDFRLDFTFKPLGNACLGPHVELGSPDGLVKLIITLIEAEDPTKVRIVMEVLERTSSDAFTFSSTQRIESGDILKFDPALWYTLYIDVENGNSVRIDVDERDGNLDSFDDDIVEFSAEVSTDTTSLSFEDPVFRSPCAAVEWVGLGDPTNYWIGDIHYRDCSDGFYPDPHDL